MAVIINNMDMPKSCSDCPMCHPKGKDAPWNYCCFATMANVDICRWDKSRLNFCPLKEVPSGTYYKENEYVNVYRYSKMRGD